MDELPEHAWDEAETIFTADDDAQTPELDVPDDEITGRDADAGLDLLIRMARDG